jgi:hypothetical protein
MPLKAPRLKHCRRSRRLCSQMEAPPQSLHLLLSRLCSQMEAPLQSLHVLLSRLCSQMEVPPQFLHLPLSRLCSQMEAPLQSLQMLLRRLCSQMEAPPQSLHRALRFLCSQMLLPPQSTHSRLRRPRGHVVCGCVVLALFSLPCVYGSSRPLPPSPAASSSPQHSRHLHHCLPCRHLPSSLPPPLPLLPPSP